MFETLGKLYGNFEKNVTQTWDTTKSSIADFDTDAAVSHATGQQQDFQMLLGNIPQYTPTAGAVDYRFPIDLDGDSYGGFLCKMQIERWLENPGQGPAQVHETKPLHQGHIWLPYPMTLSSTYAGNFADETGMHDIGGQDSKLMAGAVGVFDGLKEAVIGKTTEMSASVKMAGTSINNAKIGTVYSGQVIRNHSFNWKLSPKNESEQMMIHMIIKALKLASTPGVGGKIPDLQSLMDAKKSTVNNSASVAGSLNIPMTVSMEFYAKTASGDMAINPRLFSIKKAFITSVETNYTPSGQWNAYHDGGGIETSIAIQLKELSALTQTDIINGA